MNKRKKPGDWSLGGNIGFFIGVIVAFNIFWPAGILMLLWRFGVLDIIFDKTGARMSSEDSRQALRMDKYRIMTEGRQGMSIEYLASAVGVSYDTCLRDLQKMVAEGRFGPQAYINYVDRSIIIRPAPRPQQAPRPAPPPPPRPAQQGTGTPRQSQPQPRPYSYGRPTGAEGSNMISRDAKANPSQPSNGASNANEAKGDTQIYTALKRLLLIVGILLTGVGALTTLGVLTELSYWPFWSVIADAVPGLAMAAGGCACLGYRTFLKKRENRFRMYLVACAGRDSVTVADLASKAGVSDRKCRRDLDAMLERGLLPSTAYLDQGRGVLVLRPVSQPQTPEPEPEADTEDRYMAILRQIRQLNDDIPDEDVSRRIDEMEELSRRIFKAVQDKPEKEPQIKSFMSYYLPTTLKLLRTYADFERSGADGDNIRSAKSEIERILDTLVDGFKKQLDKLYETEAMDISSDIDVLENMLRRDGLTGDGSAFKVQQQ